MQFNKSFVTLVILVSSGANAFPVSSGPSTGGPSNLADIGKFIVTEGAGIGGGSDPFAITSAQRFPPSNFHFTAAQSKAMADLWNSINPGGGGPAAINPEYFE